MMRSGFYALWRFFPLMFCLCFLLVACGGDGGGRASSLASDKIAVNGFGAATNHVHSLIAPEPHVLLLATHLGTFRSEDRGKKWIQVSGGMHQLMQGLMDYSLSLSPLDSRRSYMLTMPAMTPYVGIPGLYTSDTEGRSWQLVSTTQRLGSRNVFFAVAGNQSATEVYIYLPDQGATGLHVSHDEGRHFTGTGLLPFGRLIGLLALPDAPGHLLAYSDDGLARSRDGGQHWSVLRDVRGGVNSMAIAGGQAPIFASGDDGISVSHDEGKTFTHVNNGLYTGLSSSPTNAQVLYGKTGTAIYRSLDGGHRWKALPPIQGNLGNLLVDPDEPLNVFLSLISSSNVPF